ncbi:hypothetical protein [Amycolatopsis sp. NBC_01480]|uniref:hypothetical protein n=1 Tax=Amycolatopsis sp. NBC_01480 TaxID=2903562 RepID=UPI002E2A3A1F|nr:hypothetical protein [Amycolatopsis sp. NBC_01480]
MQHHDCAVPVCGRPTQDVICAAHVADLVRALKSVPVTAGTGLWDELEVTLTRRHRTVVPNGRRGTETPLVFDEAASDARRGLERFVWYWAYVFASANDHLAFEVQTVPEACDWMATFPGLLASLDGAEVMVEDILRETRNAANVVDLPVSRVYAGRCGAQLEIGTCEQHLYAAQGKRTVRCPSCGAESSVDEKQQALLGQVADATVNATQVSRLLGQLGVEIAASTIRTYAQKRVVRGDELPPKLRSVGKDRRGRPSYRVGDVLDLFLRPEQMSA